jgi:hypothetical protein
MTCEERSREIIETSHAAKEISNYKAVLYSANQEDITFDRQNKSLGKNK